LSFSLRAGTETFIPGTNRPLLLLDPATLGDLADHIVAVDLLDRQPDVAVVDEQRSPGRGVLGLLCRSWTPGRGAHEVVGR
jgi:hypothetical protein